MQCTAIDDTLLYVQSSMLVALVDESCIGDCEGASTVAPFFVFLGDLVGAGDKVLVWESTDLVPLGPLSFGSLSFPFKDGGGVFEDGEGVFDDGEGVFGDGEGAFGDGEAVSGTTAEGGVIGWPTPRMTASLGRTDFVIFSPLKYCFMSMSVGIQPSLPLLCLATLSVDPVDPSVGNLPVFNT